MINSEIQELFDDSLTDERMAELLHSLSVSPEKRTEFRRHMRLQDAMKGDRIDNSLSSDEDAAIWGAITGLGVATTSVSSGYSIGWIAKAFVFMVMGVGGYLLGSSFPNLFGGGSEPIASAPAASSGVQSILPQVIAVPFPVAAPEKAAERAGGSNLAQRSNRSASSHRSASSLIAANGGSRSSRDNDGASRDANGAAHPLASGSNSDHSASRNNTPNQNLNNGDNEGARSAQNNTAPTPASALGDSAERSGTNAAPSMSAPAQPVPDSTKQNSAAAAIRPLSPEQVANALNRTNGETPSEAGDAVASILRMDGFELSYGERIGILAKNPSAVDTDPTFSNRYFDLSYRFNEGMFGFGARLGYGSFSLVSLKPQIKTNQDRNGNINLIDTIYRSTMSAEEKPLVEFFFNYRLPIGDRFAITLEALAGGSTNHNKIGGDLSFLWLLTDRIGIQAGGGFSRYWYTINSIDRNELLLEGGDGTSIDDNYVDLIEGGMFEGRYGLFFHF